MFSGLEGQVDQNSHQFLSAFGCVPVERESRVYQAQSIWLPSFLPGYGLPGYELSLCTFLKGGSRKGPLSLNGYCCYIASVKQVAEVFPGNFVTPFRKNAERLILVRRLYQSVQ